MTAEGIDMQIPEDLMEQLAAIEHERWSSQAIVALSDMTEERRFRWGRLAGLHYSELDERNKELDREQVRKSLAPLAEYLARLEAQNAKLIEALEIALDSAAQAMRQWRMFSEDREDRELSTDTDMEANLYRFTERRIEQARAALQQAKESK